LRLKGLRLFTEGASAMKKAPNLSISPEKVFFVIAKSRQSEGGTLGLDLGADSGDDLPEEHSQSSDRSELSVTSPQQPHRCLSDRDADACGLSGRSHVGVRPVL
jgi:hypothetical protein